MSQTQKIDSLLKAGNIDYKQKKYALAATTWEKASELSDNIASKRDYYYYTASAFALNKDSTNSFRCLEKAIKFYNFNDIPSLKSDEDLDFMKKSNRWKKLLESIKPVYTTNPKNVKIINSDVENFWKAYDLVAKNPEKAIEIYKKEYINKGTIALQAYYVNKISTVENFVLMHNRLSKFYTSIRKNTSNTNEFKKVYEKSFVNLKKIYPKAIFPPIYFVVGKFNSAGTVSSDGLILAIDQACLSPDIDISELNTWQKNNISAYADLPYTVAHELIHYEQSEMAVSKTLLKAAIVEGMADFIGELISGKNANQRLHIYANGKEKMIWEDFKKEMFVEDSSNWIANADQETAEKPADLGYWVGYHICKSFYNNAKNKKKAIFEMLHIKDYKLFLEQATMDAYFTKGNQPK